MKKLITSIIFSLTATLLFAKTSTPDGFIDDFDMALESAKKSGKTVLAVFSGSDWCYWCKVLEKDYLSKKEFVDEASKNFELCFIDSPKDKSRVTAKAASRNPELLKKYAIREFPTMKFIKSDGTAFDAPRPKGDIAPKAYAEALIKTIKYNPLVEKHIKPFKEEFTAKIQPLHIKLFQMEFPFSKKTEEEQRATHLEGVKLIREIVAKRIELREKLLKAKVPSEIEYEKNDLLNQLNANLEDLKKLAELKFEDAKKLYGQPINKRTKGKLK